MLSVKPAFVQHQAFIHCHCVLRNEEGEELLLEEEQQGQLAKLRFGGCDSSMSYSLLEKALLLGEISCSSAHQRQEFAEPLWWTNTCQVQACQWCLAVMSKQRTPWGAVGNYQTLMWEPSIMLCKKLRILGRFAYNQGNQILTKKSLKNCSWNHCADSRWNVKHFALCVT